MVTTVLSRPADAGQKRRLHRHSSVQAAAVSLAARCTVKNAVRLWASHPELEWPFDSVNWFAGLLPFRPPAKIDRIQLDHCAAELVQAGRTAPAAAARAILYLHGGAFLTCGLNTHRSMVTRLSRAADACVLNVDYRMLPSHLISDAIDDGLSGLRWLVGHGYTPEQIVVAGDSAGGYLAFMTTLAAIRSGLLKPSGIAAVSPFTDADPTEKLAHPNAHRCAMFPCEALGIFARYLHHAHLNDVRERITGEIASPVDAADLESLPPVTIHASTDELLLADAEKMAQRLDTAGIRCDLHLWDGQIHDFPLAADLVPEGRRAIHYIGDFVKEVTEPGEPDTNQAA